MNKSRLEAFSEQAVLYVAILSCKCKDSTIDYRQTQKIMLFL